MNMPPRFFIMLSIFNEKECLEISEEKKNMDERRRNLVYRESERKKINNAKYFPLLLTI